MEVLLQCFKNNSNFWRAPFFVSPGRDGEAQDVSGT
jgi:hypothetical protein